ncbi:MAG: hypothetical protein O7E57_13415 [Gammaproteobacteria bacterium]|nr:hypothetical protein [Gammaproteobacteria bacterium]
MNGWDTFTWIMALVLAGSALVIFAYFLRDARGVLNRGRDEEPDD